MRSARRAALAALLPVIALALPPSGASATGGSTYDPLASGTTRLTFEAPFLAVLRKHGVRLSATVPAKLHSATFALPVSGGEFDPTTNKGTIEQEGGLVFKGPKRRVVLHDLMLKIKPAPLYAKVGGGQLKLAGNAKTKVIREGFGARFTATRLRLTSKFATRLNKKLGLRDRPLKPGLPLARIVSKPQPATVLILPQGRVSLAPDPGILAKIHELHVSLNPIAPAELAGGSLFTLPLAVTGRISPDGHSGTLKTEGAIEFLQLGAGQVFWKNLWFELSTAATIAEADVEPTPAFPGKLGVVGITTFDLSAAAISSEPKTRTITVGSAQLRLSAQSAATFEEAFAKPQEKSGVFHAGELFGTVSFTAQGQ